jgi:hypothetical protein
MCDAIFCWALQLHHDPCLARSCQSRVCIISITSGKAGLGRGAQLCRDSRTGVVPVRSGDCALSSHFAEATNTKVIPVDASEVLEALN